MKVVIINGSPRKNGNTARLSEAFQAGVLSASIDNEVVQYFLPSLTYKGCQSCFSCKLRMANHMANVP